MRKLMGGAVTLACAVALMAPGTAAAQDEECDTLTECAAEHVFTTVDTTLKFVNQKVEETKLLVERTRDEAVHRANGGLHECVIQARVSPDGTGGGDAQCVSRYYGRTQPEVVTGDVVISGASIVQDATGPVVTLEGSANPIQIIGDNGVVYGISNIDDKVRLAGGLSVHTGQWSGTGPGSTEVGAFHTLAGGAFGAPGEYFLTGAVVLEGAV